MSSRDDGRKRAREPEGAATQPAEAAAASPSAEEARLAELRRKRQAKLKAVQEEKAKAEAAAATASASSDGAASSSQRDAGAGADGREDESYFEDDGDGGEHGRANGSGPSTAEAAPGGSIVDAQGRLRSPAPVSNGNGRSHDDSLEAYMSDLQAGALQPSAERAPSSRCVVLENIITLEDAADPQEAHMTRMETGNECSKWGDLLRVHVACSAGSDPSGPPVGGLGRVFVEFSTEEAAEACARAMDGRFFDGRRVGAQYYPVESFLGERLDEAGTPLEQNAITWEDIAAMNSRPASSWDTMGASAAEQAADGGLPSFATQSDAEMSEAEPDEKEGGDGGGDGEGGGEEEQERFHQQFMAAMRAQAEEAQRQQRRATQQVMERGDDAMDALVEEFPDIEGAAQPSKEDDDDSDDEEKGFLARRAEKKVLPPVDHATIDYVAVRKNFYIEVPEIKRMSEKEVDELRKGGGTDTITVRGKRCPRPVRRWAQCGLSDRVLQIIGKQNFAAPFPIQAQALPAIMNGRDVIGIAKTGSGKTMAYTLPMLRHVMDQPPLDNGEGPIGLVMVPTRELATQVYKEVRRFIVPVGLSVAAIFGGSSLKQQIAELKRCPEVVVCTPGRMIDMLTANAGRVTNLRRCTYVVMDEADRMFDLGFEPQISRIIGNVRPDRQTVLFSATFPNSVAKLARGVLHKPVQIIVGGISVVSNMIEQHVEVLTTEAKLNRLLALLKHHFDEGQIIVFVDTQEAADNLFKELLKHGLPCATLHGGMSQDDRDSTLTDFKSGDTAVLVATSVAARGLDVKDCVCVINYEVPNHYEDYVHRVGRTGRAGNTGTAYTFITPEEEKHAPDLVKALEKAGQEPPDDVLCMANAYNAKRKAGELSTKDYRQSGFKSGRGVATTAEAIAKEDKGKRAARMRERSAAGIDADDGDDEDDDDDGVITEKGVLAGGGLANDPSLSVAQAAAKAAAALHLQIGNKGGATAAAAEVQKKMMASAQAAAKAIGLGGHVAGSSSAADAAAAAAPLSFDELRAQMAAANPRMATLPEAAQRAMVGAELRSREIKQKMEAQQREAQQALLAASQAAASANAKPTRFSSDLEINDYPQTARWKVMHRESLQAIQEWTKVAITTKGAYYPPGRNPPAGERKLYLLVEGETEQAVKTARKEMRRILEEAAAVAAPDDTTTNRYAKYQV